MYLIVIAFTGQKRKKRVSRTMTRRRTKWISGNGNGKNNCSGQNPLLSTEELSNNYPTDIPKNPRGRPTKYDPVRHPKAAYELCVRVGIKNEDLALAFGINNDTLQEWLITYPELSESVIKGRWDHDSGKIQNALARRACGYDLVERTYEPRVDPDTGTTSLCLTKSVTKHMPPDPTAIIFWLCNRQKQYWRREVRHEHTGEVQTKGDPETKQLLRELLQKAKPESLAGLRESLEELACANVQPV